MIYSLQFFEIERRSLFTNQTHHNEHRVWYKKSDGNAKMLRVGQASSIWNNHDLGGAPVRVLGPHEESLLLKEIACRANELIRDPSLTCVTVISTPLNDYERTIAKIPFSSPHAGLLEICQLYSEIIEVIASRTVK